MLFRLWAAPTATTVINVLTSWFTARADTGGLSAGRNAAHDSREPPDAVNTFIASGSRADRSGTFVGVITKSPSIR